MNQQTVSETVKFDVNARFDDCELNLSITVPAGPARLDDLYPLLQILSDKIVEAAEHESVERGYAISCCKGCGACCRQLVPVSPVEARHIAQLVATMPDARRQEIQGRFQAARQRLEQAGLWEALSRPQGLQPLPIGAEYFRLGIPCPFLEDESCSIHSERPLTCREYLVVSPAANCTDPTHETVRALKMPANLWVTAARCESSSDREFIEWVPLIHALDWASAHAPPAPSLTGPELVKLVLENMPGSSQAKPVAAVAVPNREQTNEVQ